ncbi:MAG: NAD(P)H-dependent oxidoreductase subunit E, partial [Chloroflexi bacterium]|nr:NAD(P)H-dependent oxidoreductase subunit E [Chloroflexota bacterium]
CRCTVCTLQGGGRVLAAFEDALGTGVEGVSPDGRVRLVTVDCGGESSGRGPRVLVDGVAQTAVTAERATEMAAHLRTGHLAGAWTT